MATRTETFQITADAAEAYESLFVPALFAAWAEQLVSAAGPRPDDDVLDVACGTGAATRAVAARLGSGGTVVGLDLNASMLAVAARLRPDLDWRQGDAADLPFPAESFDLVTCQAGLMFFPDPVAALREMGRVVRRGGRIVVLVPGRLGSSPAYVRLAATVAAHVPGAAGLFDAYFALGEPSLLAELFRRAGLEVLETRTAMTDVVFGSLEDYVSAEIGATPLAERVDPDTYDRVLADARAALVDYVAPDGRARVPIESQVVTAREATSER
jgi:SAM-dependent methyltransferase